MAWVANYAQWIEHEKMTSAELWRELARDHRKAFGTHVDETADEIVFGNAYDCGYAQFDRHTGELISLEFSPYYKLGESIDEIYNYQTPTDIYRRMGFFPTKLYQPYQNMRHELLPAIDLFINQRTVDMDYDAKPDGHLATYRIEPSESAQHGIDGIYTAESITDAILAETIDSMTSDMTFAEARRLVNSRTMAFGEHRLVLLYIPNKALGLKPIEFPYTLKTVLQSHYEAEHANDDQDA